MNWFRVKLTAESWMSSAWQADTIWGHLCWGFKYSHGDDALEEFLSLYAEGNPPLLVSNGFPEDMLPRPVLPDKPIKGKDLKGKRKEFRDMKDAKGIQLLDSKEFDAAISGKRLIPVRKEVEYSAVTLKNQLNRLTGTTGGEAGALFGFKQYHWPSVTIYLKVADSYTDTVKGLFRHLTQSGYGKRKSVGYGQVKLESFEQFDGFDVPADANGFVSLSNFVPAADDPVHGHWDLIVKYGKLGEEYATGENPFKKPLLMLTAGSTFYDSPCKEYYGRLVRGLSPVQTDKIVQYGYALPVPMKLPVV